MLIADQLMSGALVRQIWRRREEEGGGRRRWFELALTA